MDDPEDAADALLWFGLGSFHAIFFLALLVTVLHLNAAVGGFLSALDTVRGFALGGVLWTASVLTARRAFRGLGVTARGLGASTGDVLARGFRGGAITGWVFLVALVALLVGPDALYAPAFLFIGVIGSGVAVLVGGLVGVLFAAVDVAVAALAARALK